MSYRKTEKVLAQAEAKRSVILGAAIDIIAKSGEQFTTDAVALRAGVASGLIYKYFADKNELVAAVIGQLLARDLAAMREASEEEADQARALGAAVAVLFSRLVSQRLARLRSASPAYYLTMRDEFALLIRGIGDFRPQDAKIMAGAALGAIFGMVDAEGGPKKNLSMTLLFVLRGVGVSEAVARRIVERRFALA